MNEQTRSGIFGRLTVVLIVFPICFVLSAVWRMTGDRHFSRVHLQVLAGFSDESPGDSESELTVYARSVGDVGWRLIPVQGQPGYFRQATSAVPVYSLVISSPSRWSWRRSTCGCSAVITGRGRIGSTASLSWWSRFRRRGCCRISGSWGSRMFWRFV